MKTQKNTALTGQRSFGQTMAQSARVVSGRDVPNYSLSFLNPTKRKQAGESETIVIPYIEVGRSAACAVQYGDEYPTVGRRHAAIRFDSGNIVVKHLHGTNPTIVKRPDGTVTQLTTEGQEAPLSNGSQVQFSYDGPQVRLNATPTATSKMGVTQRVSLALKQGVRPYRQAVGALALTLVGLAIGGGFVISGLEDTVAEQSAQIDGLNDEINFKTEEIAMIGENLKEAEQAIVQGNKAAAATAARLRQQLAQAKQELDEMQSELAVVSAAVNNPPFPPGPEGPGTPGGGSGVGGSPTIQSPPDITSVPPVHGAATLAEMKQSIYYIVPKTLLVNHPLLTGGKTEDFVQKFKAESGDKPFWSGTAFLTTEGKIITARHVVTPWRFNNACNNLLEMMMYLISEAEHDPAGSVDATYALVGPDGSERLQFTLSEIRMSATDDLLVDVNCPLLPGPTRGWHCPDAAMYTDWAWIPSNLKGNIVMDRGLSTRLAEDQTLKTYGYSFGKALQDSKQGLVPILSTCQVGQPGLNGGLIRVSNRAFGSGSSGGPVFAQGADNRYYGVGIVSHGIDNIGGVVPMHHLR